jgi:YesN/AraC family two-component response regulator
MRNISLRRCEIMTQVFEIKNMRNPIISATDIANVKPPYVHFKRQFHEYILYIILSGEMFIREGDVSYHLKENDILLLEPSLVHQGEKTSLCSFLYVHFSWQSQLNDVDEHSKIFFPKYHTMERVDAILEMRELAKRLVASFYRAGNTGSVVEIYKSSCIFEELLLAIALDYEKSVYEKNSPIGGKARLIVPKLVEYLEQSYADDISSTVIEEMFHYNFDYLNRQFKKYTGNTIFVYLNTVRIKRASQLIATGYYSMEEVARQTGFRDIYYFSKVFKKYTGMTPKGYRG